MSSKTAVVFTATGEQGSSVVGSLLKAGWKVIALTRSFESESAKALKAKGAELAKADLNDPESYKPALKGADAAFVNADFWAIYGANKGDGEAAAKGETQQAKNAIQACVDAGIGHIVYSTLDGGLGAKHWDSKQAVSKWAVAHNLPVTNLYMTFYFSNITRAGLVTPKDDGSGSFVLGIPAPDGTVVPGVAPEQTGLWVEKILSSPGEYKGKDVHACSDVLSIADMAKTLSALSGKDVQPLHLPLEVFNSDGLKAKLGEELWDQWDLFVKRDLKRDPKASRALVQGSWDFQEWAAQNAQLKKVLGY
ncbi:hypothetical protein EHS25_006557 [Saitozyma podzolica]|uniref:NmrA-like domain-containing protein n=1 Tax=Saitozyma podzolica TaxID=1890683 RepID=A0A427YS79_9TREE|nr:hypothetical protein EHS25_006557 [Saitozyma podzolica]